VGYVFRVELIKLLLQVAWADHRAVRAEAELIRELCHKLGLSTEERAQVEQWLVRERGLPVPNLDVLRPNKAAVMAAARMMVLADDRIATEEAALLSELEAALS
jgi:Tellurite resistance protein TerB